MKSLFLVSLSIATIPVPPLVPPSEQINISGKSSIELVGAGSAKVLISSANNFQGVQIFFPNSGTRADLNFQSGKSIGTSIQNQIGNVRTVLLDNDGDGLPDVRHTFQILSNDETRLTKIERLTWKITEAKN